MQTSSRYGVLYPSADRSDSADVPRDFIAVVGGLERSAMYGQGTLASRPTSSAGTPGIQGRFYMATDVTPHALYYDYGTGWDLVGAPGATSGLIAARPTASTLQAGATYYATDQDALYMVIGGLWQRIGPAQPGDLFQTLNAVAGAGRVLLQGQTVSRTGIYADLFAKWSTAYGAGDGTTTFGLPDLRGRMLVTQGTNAAVSTIGANEGVAVANRRPQHRHTPHTHGGIPTDTGIDYGTGGTGGRTFTSGSGGSTSAADGGSGVATDSLNAPAYFVVQVEAKL